MMPKIYICELCQARTRYYWRLDDMKVCEECKNAAVDISFGEVI